MIKKQVLFSADPGTTPNLNFWHVAVRVATPLQYIAFAKIQAGMQKKSNAVEIKRRLRSVGQTLPVGDRLHANAETPCILGKSSGGENGRTKQGITCRFPYIHSKVSYCLPGLLRLSAKANASSYWKQIPGDKKLHEQ